MQGSLKVVLSKEQFSLINLYVERIRPMIKAKPGLENYVFITRSGYKHVKVSASIRYVWNKHFYPGYFTLTRSRKIIETESYNTLGCDQQQSVSSQLNHSPRVAKEYYTAHTSKKAVTCKKILSKLIGSEKPC